MFKRLSLALGVLVFAGAAHADSYALGLKGVACPYCAYGVEKRLSKIDGVTDIRIDIADSLAIVQMRDGTPLTKQQAATAVEDAGFTLDSFEARAERGGQTGAD